MNRAPGTVWTLRRDDLRTYVRTTDDDKVAIYTPEGYELSMSRSTARLLAKRINQCLDATVKR